MKRVLTALALIPLVAWVVLWANSWIFLAVLVAVACLCYREYNEIAAGFGTLKDKVWRIGLMGYSSRKENVTLLLGALRELLK